jgi:hypothetical protein
LPARRGCPSAAGAPAALRLAGTAELLGLFGRGAWLLGCTYLGATVLGCLGSGAMGLAAARWLWGG